MITIVFLTSTVETNYWLFGKNEWEAWKSVIDRKTWAALENNKITFTSADVMVFIFHPTMSDEDIKKCNVTGAIDYIFAHSGDKKKIDKLKKITQQFFNYSTVNPSNHVLLKAINELFSFISKNKQEEFFNKVKNLWKVVVLKQHCLEVKRIFLSLIIDRDGFEICPDQDKVKLLLAIQTTNAESIDKLKEIIPQTREVIKKYCDEIKSYITERQKIISDFTDERNKQPTSNHISSHKTKLENKYSVLKNQFSQYGGMYQFYLTLSQELEKLYES